MNTFIKLASACVTLLASSTVVADDAQAPPATGTTAQPEQDAVPVDTTGTPGSTAAPNDGALPTARSDHDEQPEVASPGLPSGGLVRQAGVGGVVGYGRAGVLELGGSAGFQIASEYRAMNFSPTIGWFIADNFELSAILSVDNIKIGEADSATIWSLLAEPSYHVPFNRSLFGFLGLGVGPSYVSALGTGLALAPRVGMNVMVGRSGVLTPSLSYQYSTHDAMTDDDEVTLVAVSSSVRFNIGYTAMW
jgi:hypothetical protein